VRLTQHQSSATSLTHLRSPSITLTRYPPAHSLSIGIQAYHNITNSVNQTSRFRLTRLSLNVGRSPASENIVTRSERD
jgi:outer membrane scaffolding protein for murein synthesis (MipA/OmpV family)